MKKLIFLLLVSLSINCYSRKKQEIIENPHTPIVYTSDSITSQVDVLDSCQKMPEFPGGQNAFGEFLNQNLIYPSGAIDRKIQGKVILSFVVNADGSLTDLHVDQKADIELDKESLRIAHLMPNWTPGENNGVKVRVRVQLPIKFRLGY